MVRSAACIGHTHNGMQGGGLFWKWRSDQRQCENVADSFMFCSPFFSASSILIINLNKSIQTPETINTVFSSILLFQFSEMEADEWTRTHYAQVSVCVCVCD